MKNKKILRYLRSIESLTKRIEFDAKQNLKHATWIKSYIEDLKENVKNDTKNR